MKTKTKQWTILPETEKAAPATQITQQSVQEFRNGLAKFHSIKANSGLVQTLAYRAMLDLDHLLRLMQASPNTIIAQYTFKVTAKDKVSAKKLRAWKDAKKRSS